MQEFFEAEFDAVGALVAFVRRIDELLDDASQQIVALENGSDFIDVVRACLSRHGGR